MKKGCKCFCITLILMFVLTACSSITEKTEVEEAEFEKEYLTFEDAILRSNAAIVGEYIGTIEYENYIEQKFKVKECLYGNIDEPEIYLYSNIGTGHIDEIDYTYMLGKDIYEEGKDYILVMECIRSIMYDHDRYMLSADLFLNDNDGELLMYSQPIDIPGDISAKEYVLSVYNSIPQSEMQKVCESYENEMEETVCESEYIGIINVLELVSEGNVHNGNTYRCTVESLYKGKNINSYDDGTILIVILKDTVEVGERYIIGFNSVDKESLIYIQATKNGVYNVNDELEHEFIEALK